MDEVVLGLAHRILLVILAFIAGVTFGTWRARRSVGLVALRRVTDDLVHALYEYALPPGGDPDEWIFFRDSPRGFEQITRSEYIIILSRPFRVRFHIRQVNFYGGFHVIAAVRAPTRLPRLSAQGTTGLITRDAGWYD